MLADHDVDRGPPAGAPTGRQGRPGLSLSDLRRADARRKEADKIGAANRAASAQKFYGGPGLGNGSVSPPPYKGVVEERHVRTVNVEILSAVHSLFSFFSFVCSVARRKGRMHEDANISFLFSVERYRVTFIRQFPHGILVPPSHVRGASD